MKKKLISLNNLKSKFQNRYLRNERKKNGCGKCDAGWEEWGVKTEMESWAARKSNNKNDQNVLETRK